MKKNFKQYKKLDLIQIASEVLDFWDKENIFQKTIDQRTGKPSYIFFEGPPSANGLPGIHHVIGRTIKDIFPRYKTMKGFQVKRKAGWDTHGLPVELGVEKALGITKEDIGKKISQENYNKACKEAVMKYTDVWNDLTQKIGYWVDTENPYITYKSKYIESVWWLLKQIYNKNLLYKGYTIQPYSPKAGTGLSSHELNQPGCYKDVSDTTVVAQFKTISNTLPEFLEPYAENLYFLAWTTTPWTLPSNTALTVGKNIEYVVVATYNQYTYEFVYLILAKDLVQKQFGKKYEKCYEISEVQHHKKEAKKIPYCILQSFKGEDLLDIRYEQLLPFAKPYKNSENAFRVIFGDFVTTQEGTGIVHTAPTFGADDALAAKNANPSVPPMLVLDSENNPVPLVDLKGKFTKHMGDFAGFYVKNEYYEKGKAPEKSVDVKIAILLKTQNKAFLVEKYKHSYPHCWRTDKPILYYPLDSWFVKVSEHKNFLYDLNQKIKWKPAATGENRFGNWLQNANDWNLSRSRYWGIPIPIWRTEDAKESVCVGSLEALKKQIQKSVAAGFMEKDIFEDFVVGEMSEDNYAKIDLHKNVVDTIILVSESGKKMYRESDLIDVWFDSGAMPYAQWHYPFENKDFIDHQKNYPADFIAEGVDQTRGWFYTLHVISGLVFGKVAYKNVISNGLVLDKYGKKMSKRLGNTVDPFETLKKYGPDAMRWYMVANANPWDNLKFDLEGVEEVRRKFLGTLYNTYNFFALYANLDGFFYDEKNNIPLEKRMEIDRWILSELHTLIKNCEAFYENYEPTKVARAIQNFVVDHLSNWFVRLSRRRFWKADSDMEKIIAYQTLYECLLEISKLAAPIAPFYMENLYKDLTKNEKKISVHLEDFPECNLDFINLDLERKMQQAQKITSMVLSLRKKQKIKVRQPLARIMIPVLNATMKTDIKHLENLICAETNVKYLELLEDTSEILIKKIQPNFKKLGPKIGKNLKFVNQAIQNFDQKEIAKIEREGKMILQIKNGEHKIDFELKLEDVLISSKDIKGWLVSNEGNLTVALDMQITQELKEEGIAREMVNRIQNLRKEMDLQMNDRIYVKIFAENKVKNALENFETYLKNETLMKKLEFVNEKKTIENAIHLQIENENIKIVIHKL